MKICPSCGSAFEPGYHNGVHHGQDYCSKACAWRACRAKRGRPREDNPGNDRVSVEFRKKLRKQDRAEHERLMVALTRWDYICKAASPTRVTVARVGRAVVESRGCIPIHAAKKWEVA